MNRFGKWMIDRRTNMGMKNRSSFVKKCGVSLSVIQQLELGEGKPYHERSDETRTKIADALRVPVVQLDAFSRGEMTADKIYIDWPMPANKFPEWVKPDELPPGGKPEPLSDDALREISRMETEAAMQRVPFSIYLAAMNAIAARRQEEFELEINNQRSAASLQRTKKRR